MSVIGNVSVGPGDRMGRWLLEERLGAGGLGTVFLGRHAESGAEGAVKVLNVRSERGGVTADRFVRGTRLAARLQHPGIVSILDAGDDGRHRFVVMRLIRGPTLAELLRRRGRLPPSAAAAVIVELAGALGYLHDQGWVHRDVKPANVLRSDADGRWLLTDFDLVRPVADDDPETGDLTRSGTFVGTAAYMAPEQISGAGADARSDLFALGAVHYELVTGEPAFVATGWVEIARKIMSGPRPDPRTWCPELPAAHADAIAALLAVAPDARPASAAALIERLGPGGDRAEDVPPARPRRSSRAPQLVVGVGAALLLGGVTALIAIGGLGGATVPDSSDGPAPPGPPGGVSREPAAPPTPRTPRERLDAWVKAHPVGGGADDLERARDAYAALEGDLGVGARFLADAHLEALLDRALREEWAAVRALAAELRVAFAERRLDDVELAIAALAEEPHLAEGPVAIRTPAWRDALASVRSAIEIVGTRLEEALTRAPDVPILVQGARFRLLGRAGDRVTIESPDGEPSTLRDVELAALLPVTVLADIVVILDVIDGADRGRGRARDRATMLMVFDDGTDDASIARTSAIYEASVRDGFDPGPLSAAIVDGLDRAPVPTGRGPDRPGPVFRAAAPDEAARIALPDSVDAPDLGDLELVGTLELPAPHAPEEVFALTDGRVALGTGPTIRLLESPRGPVQGWWRREWPDGRAGAIDVTPDGALLALAALPAHVALVATDGSGAVEVLPAHGRAVAVSHAGERVAIGGATGGVVLLERTSETTSALHPRRRRELVVEIREIERLAFVGRDDRFLLALDREGTAQVWDVETGTTIDIPHRQPPLSFDFGATDHASIAFSETGGLGVLDLANSSITRFPYGATAASRSPDGRTMIGFLDGRLHRILLRGEEGFATLGAHDGDEPIATTHTRRGGLLVSYRTPGRVDVWAHRR